MPAPDRQPSYALTHAVVGLERHVAAAGWDQPVRLFALVETAELLRREPALAEQLVVEPATAAALDALTPVEQEELPEHESLENLLSGIAWPSGVLGAALAVERVMLPPQVEGELPAEAAEAVSWAAAHPQRQEIRVAVGVLRNGRAECALRIRAHDSDDSVLSGADLVPGLVAALTATLED